MCWIVRDDFRIITTHWARSGEQKYYWYFSFHAHTHTFIYARVPNRGFSGFSLIRRAKVIARLQPFRVKEISSLRYHHAISYYLKLNAEKFSKLQQSGGAVTNSVAQGVCCRLLAFRQTRGPESDCNIRRTNDEQVRFTFFCHNSRDSYTIVMSTIHKRISIHFRYFDSFRSILQPLIILKQLIF